MEITASEFKAKCLDIFDRLSTRRIDQVVVTKRGKPVAVLTPPPNGPADHAGELFGFMKGTVTIPADIDLTAPTLDEPLLAEDGLLHR